MNNCGTIYPDVDERTSDRDALRIGEILANDLGPGKTKSAPEQKLELISYPKNFPYYQVGQTGTMSHFVEVRIPSFDGLPSIKEILANESPKSLPVLLNEDIPLEPFSWSTIQPSASASFIYLPLREETTEDDEIDSLRGVVALDPIKRTVVKSIQITKADLSRIPKFKFRTSIGSFGPEDDEH